LIVLAHNFLVYVAVAAIFGIWPGATALLVIPAIAIICLNGVSGSFLFGVLTSRFRDIPPIVASIVQIMFFLSPILWKPDQIPAKAVFLECNPFFHFLNIVRRPLLGELPDLRSWIIVSAVSLVLLLLATLFFVRFRARVAYWV
jgi:ABC-2 type transport system permease protein/lipopolysaccharide transport system permease protein